MTAIFAWCCHRRPRLGGCSRYWMWGEEEEAAAPTTQTATPTGTVSAASPTATPALSIGVFPNLTENKPASGTPKTGGKIVSAPSVDPPHFDPFFAEAIGLGYATLPVYNRLVSLVAQANPYEYKVEGDLAESWEMPGDGDV